jgi:hypothetical protein
MKALLTKVERDFLIVHLLFLIICLIVLLIPISLSIGIKLFMLVLIYNIFTPLVGTLRKYNEWINIWIFSFILSIFQIWPDWFLSEQLNILVFPDDGLFKIGTVSGYMLFLWVIPFFIIIFIGLRIQERFSKKISYWIVILISLLIFGLSEMTIWAMGSWYAQNVKMFEHVALYIIIPEIILGCSTYWAFKLSQDNNILCMIPLAFMIMLLYLGSAVFFYFLIEQILL